MPTTPSKPPQRTPKRRLGRKPKPANEKTWRAPAKVRRPEVLRLKLAGYTPAEIAVKLNLTPTIVNGDLKELMAQARQAAPAVQEMRDEQAARLEWLMRNLHTAIDGGDPKAIATALKILERQAKLLGLDVDARQTLTIRPSGDWDTILRAPASHVAMGLPE